MSHVSMAETPCPEPPTVYLQPPQLPLPFPPCHAVPTQSSLHSPMPARAHSHTPPSTVSSIPNALEAGGRQGGPVSPHNPALQVSHPSMGALGLAHKLPSPNSTESDPEQDLSPPPLTPHGSGSDILWHWEAAGSSRAPHAEQCRAHGHCTAAQAAFQSPRPFPHTP